MKTSSSGACVSIVGCLVTLIACGPPPPTTPEFNWNGTFSGKLAGSGTCPLGATEFSVDATITGYELGKDSSRTGTLALGGLTCAPALIFVGEKDRFQADIRTTSCQGFYATGELTATGNDLDVVLRVYSEKPVCSGGISGRLVRK